MQECTSVIAQNALKAQAKREREKRRKVFINGSDNFWIDQKGRIFHLDMEGTAKHWTVVETVEDCTEYPYADISFQGTFRRTYIHRLVAETFIPNPKHLPVVMHKNNLKNDYDVDNLKWGTQSENIRDAYVSGLCSNAPDSTKIKEACKMLEQHESVHHVAVTCVLPSDTVSKIKRRKRWTAISQNYKW